VLQVLNRRSFARSNHHRFRIGNSGNNYLEARAEIPSDLRSLCFSWGQSAFFCMGIPVPRILGSTVLQEKNKSEEYFGGLVKGWPG
jgi:hypothetical protein